MQREVKRKKNPGSGKKTGVAASSFDRPKISKAKAKSIEENRPMAAKKPPRAAAPDNPKPKRIPPTALSGKESPKTKSFHIVGVGASAGGLEAFTQLLRALPADTGMAFVLIQHLDPKHESMLTRILSQKTKVPVKEVNDGMAVEPDHVYIMPPNRNMTISGGVLGLRPRTEARGQHMPIDRFFRSLAEDQKSRAIGVVLSGTASDGALGLRAIKVEGGITFAQDEKSAKFGGMPHSAAAAGGSDFILPPEGIAKELARISRHPFPSGKIMVPPNAERRENSILPNGNGLRTIFTLLESATGVDFTHYKQATLKRQILRRMNLRKIGDMGDYVKSLEEHPGEVEALYHDLLIHVTGFFRDPETFAALADKVFPEITRNRGRRESPVRVWVPGCSTGEEAYSLAIALMEFLGRKAGEVPIQIFATDIFAEAINKARAGRYLEGISSDLSAERLDRFFVKMDGGYQVSKFIREMCVFATHDLTKDPPFSNVDLVSCRNVMIYLGQESQRRAMAVFHYALKPAGFLLLGKSEAIGRVPDLFAPVDRKHKIYSKKPGPARPYLDSGPARYGLPKIDIGQAGKAEFDFRKEADRTLLSKFAPAGVIVNDRLEVLDFRGHTGPFLEHGPGEASLNLLKIAREGIHLPLRMAIQEAKKQSVPMRKEGFQVKSNGQLREVNLEVIPLKSPLPDEGYFLVLFEDASARRWDKPYSRPLAPRGKSKQRVTEEEREKVREELLERELEATKKHLQSITEEHESASEELRAANEEVLSANEELQSINEEMETAKEELESTNEELTTLNDELQNRNFALDQLNSDMMNLFASANLPILILGGDLCLRRFTPMAEKRLGVTATDIGRSIINLRLNVDVHDLETLILATLDKGTVQEKEVRDREGTWYSMQVRPYKTLENKTDGVVMTWVDISALKGSLEEIKESRDYAEAIIETVREPLLILDESLRIKRANRSFYQVFQTSPEETENRLLYDLGDRQWNIPELKRLLDEVLPQNASFEGLEVEHEFPAIGPRTMQLNARRIRQSADRHPLILLAMEDVTERKRMEQEVRKSQDDLERRVRDRTADLAGSNEALREEILKREKAEQQIRHMQKMEAIGTLTGGIAHDLNNILAPIVINSEMALLDLPAESVVRDLLQQILKSGLRGKDLVTQLLLFSRKSEHKHRSLPLSPLVKETFKLLRSTIPSSIQMKLSLETDGDLVDGDPSQIQQVIMNLCTNAAYALSGTTGSIDISLQAVRLGSTDLPQGDMEPGDYLVLSVKDTGCGMHEDVINRIFEPFFSTKPTGEGTGLGLSVAHGIVKSHKGGITVYSEPGKGSVFKVYLPKGDTGVSVEPEAFKPILGGNERILLVDDEESVVNSVRNMLQHLGYEVTAVMDSREALKLFSENPSQFDLVMTDQTMPFMTGENLGKEMMRIRPDISVILCTGYTDFISSEKAIVMGFRGFIMKPFTVREGAELVRSVLDQSPK